MRGIDRNKAGKLPFWRSRRVRNLVGAAIILGLVVIVERYDLAGGSSNGVPDRAVEGRASVIDGDSLRLGSQEVRLQGIDAPEGRQMCQRKGRDWPCGRRAAQHLKALAGRGTISCAADKRDRFGRLLATCRQGKTNLNRQMVADGWAVSYGRYAEAERAAKRARRGIWNGRFLRPREWRRKHPRR